MPLKFFIVLPVNSFTLINDEKNNIYLAKVKKFEEETVVLMMKNFKNILVNKKQIAKITYLKSYDLLLNDKYNVVFKSENYSKS